MTTLPEYIVTLRIAADTNPAGWDWSSLMEDNEFVLSSDVCPSGHLYRAVPDGPRGAKTVVPINFVAEPEHLLGRWVTVSWHNGTSMVSESGTLLSVLGAGEHAKLTLAPTPSRTSEIHLSKVCAITPGRKPSK